MRIMSATLLMSLLVGSTVLGQMPPPPPPPPPIDSIETVLSADGAAGSGKLKATITGTAINNGSTYQNQFYVWDVPKQSWVRGTYITGLVNTGAFSLVDKTSGTTKDLYSSSVSLDRAGKSVATNSSAVFAAP